MLPLCYAAPPLLCILTNGFVYFKPDGSTRSPAPVPHVGRFREREDQVGGGPQRAAQDPQEEQAAR